MMDWFKENWLSIAAPLAVFIAFFVIAPWIRKIVFNLYTRLMRNVRWEGDQYIRQSVRGPFFHWILLLGAYVAIHISVLPEDGKVIADRVIGTLFAASVFWVLITISEKLLRHYLSKLKLRSYTITSIVNFSRIAFIVAGVLVVLDIWGAPTTPVILIIATVVLVAILAARNSILNIFSGIELSRGNIIKQGDYIKLESGEEGYVLDISWNNTTISSLNKNLIVIPNSKLIQGTIINYGRPLKVAREPFKFYTQLHLKELTGIKASNIVELLEGLKNVPDSVIYYHTHHFIHEHQYLIPEPANDFSVWIDDTLDNSVLSEKVAGVDTFEFTDINALRMRIVAVIEEHISTNTISNSAAPGRDFHFMKSTGFVMPTAYVAHDLREFVEILRIISTDSLYFHMFESKLRLGKGINDFSVWLKEILDETDIANNISRLDPYNYTLGGLRSAIIQLVEKRIK